jgi:glutamate formiminotransferase
MSEEIHRLFDGPIVACVPNFSEGADEACVRAIVCAMRVEGVRLLDWSMDSDHNRSVVTVAGPLRQLSNPPFAQQEKLLN